MQGEGALHTDAEAHLANGESLLDTTCVAGDHNTGEHLDTRAAALNDPHVHAYRVARTEIRDVGSQGCLVDGLDQRIGHDVSSSVPQVTAVVVPARAPPVTPCGRNQRSVGCPMGNEKRVCHTRPRTLKTINATGGPMPQRTATTSEFSPAMLTLPARLVTRH